MGTDSTSEVENLSHRDVLQQPNGVRDAGSAAEMPLSELKKVACPDSIFIEPLRAGAIEPTGMKRSKSLAAVRKSLLKGVRIETQVLLQVEPEREPIGQKSVHREICGG